MTGIVSHRGENRIDYRKVGCDGRSSGRAPTAKTPVCEVGDLAVGLLICMDVQDADLTNAVTGGLLASKAPFKVMCVPGDIDPKWFTGDAVPHMCRGEINLAACNNVVNRPTASSSTHRA